MLKYRQRQPLEGLELYLILYAVPASALPLRDRLLDGPGDVSKRETELSRLKPLSAPVELTVYIHAGSSSMSAPTEAARHSISPLTGSNGTCPPAYREVKIDLNRKL